MGGSAVGGLKFSPARLFSERGKAVCAAVRRKTGRGLVLPDHRVHEGTMNASEPTPPGGESVSDVLQDYGVATVGEPPGRRGAVFVGSAVVPAYRATDASGGWTDARQGAVAPCPERSDRRERPRSGVSEGARFPRNHRPAGGVSA